MTAHVMIEVPLRHILSQHERSTLSNDKQSELSGSRAALIRESLYSNYRTRHLANRITTFDGVLYIKRSHNSVMRDLAKQPKKENHVEIT